MECPICGNEKVKKVFVAGTSDVDSKIVACDACVKKKKKTKKK